MMTSSTNLLSLPEDVLLRISTTISISDIIQLVKTNKLLNQLMMKEKAIKYYCFHNNIPLIMPSANVTPVEIWQGLYYFTEAEKIKEKISVINDSVNTILQKDESLYNILLMQNNNIALSDAQAQHENELKCLRGEAGSLQTNYDSLIDKAVEKKNFIALLSTVRNNIKTLRSNDIQNYMEKFAAEESQLKGLEDTYGVILNLFVAGLYIGSARCLLLEKENIESFFRNTIQNQSLRVLDVEVRKQLGMPIFQADSLEENEKIYGNEIQQLLDRAQENLSIFVKEIKSLDHYVILSALKICDMDNAGLTLETLISELSDEIDNINKKNTLNISIGRKPS